MQNHLPPAHASARKDEPVSRETSPGGDASRVLRILFVDDCPVTISSMQKFCKLLGFDSLGVKNGLAAIDVAREFRPNIVIMDISMPVLDGYKAARLIRHLENGAEIVLVAMTGHGEESYKERAWDAGFDHFWLKPVDFNVMRSLFASIQRDLAPPA